MADIAMSSGAAGKVLGPRPGKAACSFRQGVVEIVLRIVNGAVGILPIITGALIIGFTVSASDSSTSTSSSSSSGNSSEPIAYAAGAISISGGALVAIWALIMIVLRLLNIGLLNLGSKYFLAVDVIIHFVLAALLVGGGVVSIVTATEWTTDEGVCGAAIATVIVCFISAGITVALAVYVIVYIVKEWNDKIIKYTIKEAITG